jgi:hypothetical protein
MKSLSDRIVGAWRVWQNDPRFPFDNSHCINGTKVVVETFHHYGVEAEATQVDVSVFNRTGWECYQRDISLETWPKHAWSVGVYEGQGTHVPTGPNRWNGHLVALTGEDVVDISARQFQRPDRGIAIDALTFRGEVPYEGWCHVDVHNQTHVLYRRVRSLKWKSTRGWQRDHSEQTKELIRRIEVL